MSFIRRLPGTNIDVSAIGLGTVKIGRDQRVKYPQPFSIPSDKEVKSLLALASDIGINFIDTAPAYGNSESRLGQLIENRQDWIIASKVGEEFIAGESSFNFSAQHTRLSVERSLKRLNTDYLDIVLIHSDGNDLEILQQSDCVECLKLLQQQGLIRALGMSTKTIEGGILAAESLDMVMLTYNLQQQDKLVLEHAKKNNRGVLVKKGLMSGHLNSKINDPVRESMEFVLKQPGIHSMIVGTINPQHLKYNTNTAIEILAGC